MAGIAKLIVVGHVGKDPETKEVNGKQLCTFSVAVSDNYKNKSGELVKNTTWIKVEAWDKTADVLAKFVKKGNEIYLEGTPKIEAYTDKQGTAQAALVLRVREFTFIGGSKQDSSSSSTTNTTTTPPTTLAEELSAADNLPF